MYTDILVNIPIQFYTYLFVIVNIGMYMYSLIIEMFSNAKFYKVLSLY